MIYDLADQIEAMVDSAIDKKLQSLTTSYPCEVKSIEGGTFATIKPLQSDTQADIERKIPIIQTPYMSMPLKQGDIGLAISCDYLFEDLVEKGALPRSTRAMGENGLAFIPLCSNLKFKGEDNALTITSQSQLDTITLKDNELDFKIGQTIKAEAQTGITLKAGQTTIDMSPAQIEIKGASASIGEILDGICQALLKANLDPVAGNGAPLASPSLTSAMPELIAKIKSSFK